MEHKINKKDFLKIIRGFKRIVGPKQLPVVADTVRIMSDEGMFFVFRTNLCVSVGVTFRSDFSNFDVLANLSGVLNSLDGSEDFDFQYDQGILKINGINVNSEYAITDYVDTVYIPKSEYCDNGELVSAVKWGLIASSDNDERKNLASVFLSRNYICGTDGHRLHMTNLVSPIPFENNLVCSDSLRQVRTFLSNDTFTEYADFDNHFFIMQGNAVLKIKMIEGQYPDVKKILAMPTPTTASIKMESKQSIKRFNVISKMVGFNEPCIFDANTNKITFHSNEISQKYEVDGFMEDNKVGINPKYIKQALSGGKQDCTLNMSGRTSPVTMLFPHNRMAMIMPMKIRV